MKVRALNPLANERVIGVPFERGTTDLAMFKPCTSMENRGMGLWGGCPSEVADRFPSHFRNCCYSARIFVLGIGRGVWRLSLGKSRFQDDLVALLQACSYDLYRRGMACSAIGHEEDFCRRGMTWACMDSVACERYRSQRVALSGGTRALSRNSAIF